MLLDKDVELLKAIPLFSKIDPRKLKLIAFTAKRTVYKPQEIIFKKGDPGHDVLILLEGKANATLPGNNTNITITVHQGEIAGEVSVLCGTPRMVTLTADSAVTVLSLEKDLFTKLLKEIPDLAVQIVYDLARRLASTVEQLDRKTEKKIS